MDKNVMEEPKQTDKRGKQVVLRLKGKVVKGLQ